MPFKDTEQAPLRRSEFLETVESLKMEIAALRTTQSEATAAALEGLMTDPATWERVMEAIQMAAAKKATNVAGQGVFWLLKQFLTKSLLVAVVVVLTAKLFGWDIAAKVGKWVSNL